MNVDLVTTGGLVPSELYNRIPDTIFVLPLKRTIGLLMIFVPDPPLETYKSPLLSVLESVYRSKLRPDSIFVTDVFPVSPTVRLNKLKTLWEYFFHRMT